jgi:hypothetical protein
VSRTLHRRVRAGLWDLVDIQKLQSQSVYALLVGHMPLLLALMLLPLLLLQVNARMSFLRKAMGASPVRLSAKHLEALYTLLHVQVRRREGRGRRRGWPLLHVLPPVPSPAAGALSRRVDDPPRVPLECRVHGRGG